jgi:hypothetical protein
MAWALAALYGFMGLYIWPLAQGFWPTSLAWFTDFDGLHGLHARPNPLLTLQAAAVALYAVHAWRALGLTARRVALHHLVYSGACLGWLAVFPAGYQVYAFAVPLVGIGVSLALGLLLRRLRG